MPPGWVGDSKIDWDALLGLNPDEVMLVDMIDQSSPMRVRSTITISRLRRAW